MEEVSHEFRVSSSERSATHHTVVVGGLAAFALVVSVLASACTGDITEYSTTVPGRPKGPKHFVRAHLAIPNRYIVVLRDDAGFKAQDFDATQVSLASSYRAEVTQSWRSALKGFVATMSEADALALADDPMVAFVRRTASSRCPPRSRAPPGASTASTSATCRSRARYTYNDDGARRERVHHRHRHPTSPPRVRRPRPSGFNAIDDGNGTTTATATARTWRAPSAARPTASPRTCSCIAVRVLDCTGSRHGLRRDRRHRLGDRRTRVQPAVANMSLGGGARRALDTAVRNAIAAGVTFAVAAGNDNADACARLARAASPRRSPSAPPTRPTRARRSPTAAPASTSSRPGVSITSAWNTQRRGDQHHQRHLDGDAARGRRGRRST